MFRKITTGFVVQQFDDLGNFLGQTFEAGDDVVYEKDFKPICVDEMPLKGDEYHPFDMFTREQVLAEVAQDEILLEVARKAIEDLLIEMRDDRVSMLRNNGLVCKEKDGSPSSIIRMGPEDAVRIGLKAIAEHLKAVAD